MYRQRGPPGGKMLRTAGVLRAKNQEDSMNELYYIGLDVHKKSISYTIKQADGGIVEQGQGEARRAALSA